MKIVCDNCSTKYSIADEKVRGKVFKIKCKKCSHIIVVKGQEAAESLSGFEQKDTRVFDYSGFEGAGPKDGAAAEPIWHLVVDREQVGPLTVGEVAQKWAAGEVDAETYTWREGFDDWKRLGSIDELASVTQPEASEGEPAEPPAHRPADPTDLFAGAGTSMDDDLGHDLFESRGRPSSPALLGDAGLSAPALTEKPRRSGPTRDEPPLFSAAEASSGYSEPVPKADLRPMTGQRNENSVLFSLNNLAALAAGEAAAAPSSRSSGLSSFASAGPEGSGLIDIRAMAAMTMGAAKKDTGSHKATDDDLPVFSATSFSAPTAGVLMPTVQPGNTKLLWWLVGVFGALIVIGLCVVIYMLVGRRSSAATTPAPPADVRPEPSERKPPVVTASPAPTAPVVTPSNPPPAQPTAPPPTVTPVAAPPVVTPHDEPKKPEPAKPEPAKPDSKKPNSPPARPVATPPVDSPKPVAPPETPKPVADTPKIPDSPKPTNQTCDEVACLVSPDLPCCPKRNQPHGSSPDVGSAGLPEKLDQSDIIAGMKNVTARVMACNDRFKIAGSFKVKVTVVADGSVTGASAGPPIAGTGAASCVEGAVKGAHFKKTKNSITFNYPYTFR